MTEQSETPEPGISDEQLPEDLQPGEDNPLAEPLDPDDEATKDPDELGMDDTQEDTGHYRSEGELGDSDTPSPDDSETERRRSRGE